jgi:hypothetical protein
MGGGLDPAVLRDVEAYGVVESQLGVPLPCTLRELLIVVIDHGQFWTKSLPNTHQRQVGDARKSLGQLLVELLLGDVGEAQVVQALPEFGLGDDAPVHEGGKLDRR